MFLGSYARRIAATGILEPVSGLTLIQAPRSDRIEKIHVAIGDTVRKNDPLLTLKGDFETQDGNIHVARIRQLDEDRSRLNREMESATQSFVEQRRVGSANGGREGEWRRLVIERSRVW